eukprot:TRINITY_DN1444_c0_g1::TRINITY_DN1444_c0_g1_i2::g.27153::m.27153 TRINITY_DN1444_c0_g1::TRINITY_DN1444_c0_g1_i2::g.27153  ORF type:complete len:882 (+),score=100.96,sp/Q6B9X6/VWKA_DICDI/34.33/1e-12,VWA_2/PF13519.1/1.5e+04,VWA_2/PF13519.1/1.5e-06,VWA_2/PF13519.1/1.7e+03,VWA_2/PF13519.1/1.7e-08,VWA_2/PF13519.1/1.1e-21,VWA/PF00092.23/1.1e-05,VWA/PF00092.23/0.14,VWA/PF00092.23/2.8e-16,VWA_3/PF13768.1/0.029,VWA_3/PF13768.1/0.11,VWA_3/PF13768.1/0.0011,vWA-TerF-like/PF10138.4/4.4,vWA-TerF-like/PF10138.4/
MTSEEKCYRILDVKDVDQLPICLVDLMTVQFKAVVAKIARESPGKLKTEIVAPVLQDLIHGFNDISKIVGKNTYENMVKNKQGCMLGGLNMFTLSHPRSRIPMVEKLSLEQRAASQASDKEREALLSDGMQAVSQYYQTIPSKPNALGQIQKSEVAWISAETLLASQVNDLVQVLEDTVFPCNKFTRRKADFSGSSLYLPGLIKAVITDFNYKKYFSTKSAGGRRAYAVAIALDVSLSMNGHLASCAIESVACLIMALNRIGIENFSLVLFGDGVRIIKLEEQPWDGACIFTFLSNLRFDRDVATMDADGINVCLDLLARTNVRGPKSIFVFTDGFSTSGLRLTAALDRAEKEDVEVIALGVGFDQTFVSKCYGKYITAALPSAVPLALKALFEKQECENQDVWSDMLPTLATGAENIASILDKAKAVFPGLLDELHKERISTIIPGSRASDVTVDICFVLDCTGSMAPFFSACKSKIKDLPKRLKPAIKAKNQGITLKMNYAVVGYRDFGDAEKLVPQAFTDNISHIDAFLNKLSPFGGEDGPEDVLGALDYAATNLTWTKPGRLKFIILMGDAPSHGSECNDDPTDRYRDPAALAKTVPSVSQVVAKLRSDPESPIRLFFTRIRPNSTQKMEDALRREMEAHWRKANQGPDVIGNQIPANEELYCIDMFNADASPEKGRFHFVFVLDESGSMGGQKWNELIRAYQQFLARRRGDQGGNDIVSVITFNSSARLQVNAQSIHTAPANFIMAGGGTSYVPALQMAQSQINTHARSAASPILVFMSDGETSDGAQAVEITRQLGSANVLVHTIGFQTDSSARQILSNMATVAGGKYHDAVTGNELVGVFAEVAAGCSMSETLAKSIGDVLSSEIANRIAIDFF